MRAAILVALLASTALTGCTLFGRGNAEEAGGGLFATVVVQVDGPRPVFVELVVTQLGREAHRENFTVPADGEVERKVPVTLTAVNVIRAHYSMDAGGRAATGVSENSYDPSRCPGATWRVTFRVQTGEDITATGNDGVCRSQT